MKKLAFLIFSILLFGCDKEDKPSNPIDQLPPATQTGAGTFGCLVNGVPFVDNSGFFNCFYQLVDGEYYFGIKARSNVLNLRQINIGSLKKTIIINENISLNNYIDNEFYAEISYNNQSQGAWTTSAPDGILRFQRFDLAENTVSATFSFTIVDEFGYKYEITEGRFDAHFTQ
jgi:hypothetical protein